VAVIYFDIADRRVRRIAEDNIVNLAVLRAIGTCSSGAGRGVLPKFL
jgi:hypothetical protein